MKFIHLSDLHLGKRLNGFSLLEDQAWVLSQILSIIDAECPDGVFLAGDLYDQTIPSVDAVAQFDNFLVQLSKRQLQIFIISGNHDSAPRLSFGSRLMEKSGIHIAPGISGPIAPIFLEDAYGKIAIYLLPFFRPATIARLFPNQKIQTSADAMQAMVEQMHLNACHRNILVAHQFVSGGFSSESEDLLIGGVDPIPPSLFAPFDYVALGHLHRPQNCGSPFIRYCGTPMKYSFSEAADEKSATIVELNEKGALQIRLAKITPLREMREIRGTYASITEKRFYDGTSYPHDYLHVTLTDEMDIPNAMAKLRCIYPYLMKLDYDNTRTRQTAQMIAAPRPETKTPFALFSDFYQLQNHQPLSQEQAAFLHQILEQTEEDLPS